MATDALNSGSRTDFADSARPAPWPIGRWLLICAVLGWFALLILVPSLALVRQVVQGGLHAFFRDAGDGTRCAGRFC